MCYYVMHDNCANDDDTRSDVGETYPLLQQKTCLIMTLCPHRASKPMDLTVARENFLNNIRHFQKSIPSNKIVCFIHLR